MNKQEYMKTVLASYPAWQDDEHVVKLKARGLKRLIEHAFDEGAANQREAMRKDCGADDFSKLFPWMKK